MKNVLTAEFDSDVYSLDLLKHAAYRFTGRAISSFCVDGKKIKCSLTLLEQNKTEAIEKVLEEFQLEVLDQDLRQKISKETAPIRNAILALAFSKTGIQSGE